MLAPPLLLADETRNDCNDIGDAALPALVH